MGFLFYFIVSLYLIGPSTVAVGGPRIAVHVAVDARDALSRLVAVVRHTEPVLGDLPPVVVLGVTESHRSRVGHQGVPGPVVDRLVVDRRAISMRDCFSSGVQTQKGYGLLTP